MYCDVEISPSQLKYLKKHLPNQVYFLDASGKGELKSEEPLNCTPNALVYEWVSSIYYLDYFIVEN